MHELHRSPVLDSEIDSLGHMNVRYYLTRVDRAHANLLGHFGLAGAVPAGAFMRRYDTYSRFRREQFAGAELTVVGGVLEITADHVRCYFEIRNPARDEIAATFVTAGAFIDAASQQRLPIPEGLVRVNEEYGVRLPEHGRPRSLSLEPPPTDLGLAELDRRIGHDAGEGMMSGRREGVIDAADCDASGRLREGTDPMFAMHRGGRQSFGPPVMKTDEGHRFGWAMIETRALVLALPSAGDRLVSLGADVGLGERWRQSRRWTFLKESGVLISVNDTVGIALDLDQRHSIPIPGKIRASIERSFAPDLA